MLYTYLVLIKFVAAWNFSYVVFFKLLFFQMHTYNVYVIMIMMLKVQ